MTQFVTYAEYLKLITTSLRRNSAVSLKSFVESKIFEELSEKLYARRVLFLLTVSLMIESTLLVTNLESN